GTRDGRGRVRAVPPPAGPAHAHGPRPGARPGGMGPSGAGQPADPGRAVRLGRESSSVASRPYARAVGLDRFDYDLPPEAIAQRPAGRRPDARMLVALGDTGSPRHLTVADLPGVLEPGD